MRRCTKCDCIKDEDEFQRTYHRDYPCALRGDCRACVKIRASASRKRRVERDPSYHRDRYAKCREKQLANKRRFHQENRARLAEKQRRYYYSEWGYPTFLFNAMKCRVRKGGPYAGRKIFMTRTQLREWVLGQEIYQRLFDEWRAANFTHALAPTIDRINPLGDYALNNIQLLTMSDNSKKGWAERRRLKLQGDIYA